MFKNKIDKLENRQNKYLRLKEKRKEIIQYRNSCLEAKIKKLEEKAFANRTELETFESDIDLKLKRNAKLIIVEVEYATNLGKKYLKEGK